jgi:fatty acid CoA ligase FadD9
VLLTGATGYLGRFLCMVAERLSQSGRTLICIARGRDSGAARDRIADLDRGDPDLTANFKPWPRITEVLAGDIDGRTWVWMAQPGIGWPTTST